MKICYLTPCLMQDNNREANNRCLQECLEIFPEGHHFIYAQEYKEDDFFKHPNVEYVGDNPTRQGFVKPRNELIKAFYNSDYDYAIFRDGPDHLSKSCYNDFATLMQYLSTSERIIPIIQTTLGLQIEGNRMMLKQQSDYFDNVHVLAEKSTTTQGDLHFCIFANFKKHFDVELWVPEESNPKVGIYEDRMFANICKQTFRGGAMLAPTIVTSKMGGSKASTWVVSNDGKFNYPKMDFGGMQNIIDKYVPKTFNVELPKNITIPRVEQFKELLKPYKPRKKKVEILDGLF